MFYTQIFYGWGHSEKKFYKSIYEYTFFITTKQYYFYFLPLFNFFYILWRQSVYSSLFVDTILHAYSVLRKHTEWSVTLLKLWPRCPIKRLILLSTIRSYWFIGTKGEPVHDILPIIIAT